MFLGSVHAVEILAQRKPLYLHILCSVQLNLLVNVGTTFSVALASFFIWSAKLAALTFSSAFFLVATSDSVYLWYCNDTSRIYNLISVPQITRLLSGDAIVSSKTDLHNGSKKEKRSYGKIKNKTMLKI